MNQTTLDQLIDSLPSFSKEKLIDQVKFMAFFYTKAAGEDSFQAKHINQCFTQARIKAPTNIPARLNELKDKKLLLLRDGRFLFTRAAHQDLDQQFSKNKPKQEVSNKLRDLLPQIPDKYAYKFLDEVIQCYEIKAYRAAIVMSWLLTMHYLYTYVIDEKLSEFNAALKKTNHKPDQVKQKSDLTEFKESIFIEICRSALIITNDQRKILVEKLDIRNSCAHPNNITVREAKATSYIEDLVENIILLL